MIKLKIGRNIVEVSEKDIILDNGACFQLITQRDKKGHLILVSKKLFKDLRTCGLVYTNEELTQKAMKTYGHPIYVYWKFGIPRMKELGY